MYLAVLTCRDRNLETGSGCRCPFPWGQDEAEGKQGQGTCQPTALPLLEE